MRNRWENSNFAKICFVQNNELLSGMKFYRLYFLLIGLIVGISSWAAPVDQQTALARAKAFVAERGSDMQLGTANVKKAPRKSGNEESAYYYIFNAEGRDNGFVIVSGSDLMDPILGYSDHGSIDPDHVPDGLKALLQSYRDAVDEMGQQDDVNPQASERRGIKRSMEFPKHHVKPFLTKFWNQYSPYNIMNPVVNDTICPVGCTTVALGEVMGYYEYPAIMPGVVGYTTSTNQIRMPSLKEYEIDWSNMLSNYQLETYDSIQNAAVGKFLLQLGCAFVSDFQTVSTKASLALAPPILRACGYKCSALTQMTSKTDQEWEDIFFDDVSHGRPVMVSGINVLDNGSSHAYLIDGYDMDGLWHIDWGWSGMSAGYFRITDFSPYYNTRSYSYKYKMSFVYNIEPNSETSVAVESTQKPYDCLTTTSLTFDEMATISITRTNQTGAKRQFNQALGLVDDNGQLVRVLDSETKTYTTKGSQTSIWNISDLSGYRNGHLRAYPVSQVVGGDSVWHFDICKAENSCLDIDIVNGDYTLSPVPAFTYDSFEVDNSLPFPVGAARKYVLTVTNNKMNEHMQWLYCFEDTIKMDIQQIRVPALSTIQHEFTYIPQETGEHIVRLCIDSTRTEVLFEKAVKVTSSVAYSLKLTDWEMDNFVKGTSKTYFYGDKLRLRFTLKNTGKNDYNDFIRPLLTTTTWYDTKKIWAHIPVGESRDFEFECDHLDYGVVYSIRVTVKSSSHSNADNLNTALLKQSFRTLRGACWWDKDGVMTALAPPSKTYTVPEEAVAISFYGISQPNGFKPNSNPNTIYYLTKDFASSLPTQNKVINGEAKIIHLTDDSPVFVPLDFKADSIVYTRTFDKGFTGRRGGSNWSTITLPFTPDKVFNTVDSVEVDWFRPGDTEEKNFWLREFSAEEGFYAYFTDVEEFKPNTPYIVTVPDNYKGEEYSLVGKPLEFTAVNADVLSGKIFADAPHFNFIGSLTETKTLGDYIFCLNEEDGGNSFVYQSEPVEVKPFRAYFTAATKPREGTQMYVASYIFQTETDVEEGKKTDGVIEIAAPVSPSMPTHIGVYTLSGVKVASVDASSLNEVLSTLPKGLYIINGKKVLVR